MGLDQDQQSDRVGVRNRQAHNQRRPTNHITKVSLVSALSAIPARQPKLRRLNAPDLMIKVTEGVKFKDGIEVKKKKSAKSATEKHAA
ncbi:MAG: hypothetical protein WBP42_01545 [Candidatus Zixiibacteriota bacterium]